MLLKIIRIIIRIIYINALGRLKKRLNYLLPLVKPYYLLVADLMGSRDFKVFMVLLLGWISLTVNWKLFKVFGAAKTFSELPSDQVFTKEFGVPIPIWLEYWITMDGFFTLASCSMALWFFLMVLFFIFEWFRLSFCGTLCLVIAIFGIHAFDFLGLQYLVFREPTFLVLTILTAFLKLILTLEICHYRDNWW